VYLVVKPNSGGGKNSAHALYVPPTEVPCTCPSTPCMLSDVQELDAVFFVLRGVITKDILYACVNYSEVQPAIAAEISE